MTKNFIHFTSEVACMLSINGKEIGVIDNENCFEQDIITNTNIIYVTYSPIIKDKSYIPYTFALNTSNTPTTYSEYIKVIPFPNNQYDIIMKPFYYYQVGLSQILLSQNVGKYFITIINDNVTKINIYNGTNIVYSLSTHILRQAKAKIKDNYIIVEGVIDEENYYLLILNTKDFSVIYNDITQSIDNTDDYIQCYQSLHTLAHHAKICKINFNPFDKQVFYVYEKEFPELAKSNLLVPYSMLEAIKIGDENLIRDNMGANLSTTPLAKFQGYFGDIQEIYFNRHREFTNKLNYTIFNGNYKNYDFVIDNGKIVEIEEIF